jgi:hypothetical protein
VKNREASQHAVVSSPSEIVRSLAVTLATRYPSAKLTIGEPKDLTDDVWHLDITHHDTWLVVEFHSHDRHWGLSKITSDTGYGERADETFSVFPLDRIIDFMSSAGLHPKDRSLKSAMEFAGVTDEERQWVHDIAKLEEEHPFPGFTGRIPRAYVAEHQKSPSVIDSERGHH